MRFDPTRLIAETRAQAFREAATIADRTDAPFTALCIRNHSADDAPTAQRAGAGVPVGLSQVGGPTPSAEGKIEPVLSRHGSSAEIAELCRGLTSYPFADITDCVEDGFTVPAAWGPGEDGGLDG